MAGWKGRWAAAHYHRLAPRSRPAGSFRPSFRRCLEAYSGVALLDPDEVLSYARAEVSGLDGRPRSRESLAGGRRVPCFTAHLAERCAECPATKPWQIREKRRLGAGDGALRDSREGSERGVTLELRGVAPGARRGFSGAV